MSQTPPPHLHGTGLSGEVGGPTFGRVAIEASPLLIGVTLLTLGLGLLQSLVGVRAAIEGFPTAVTGILMSTYYMGFLAGALWVPKVVADVGHIRAFSALASTASVAFLLHGVFVGPVPWAILRLATGACMAGAMVVAETWLNGRSTDLTRGQLLSLYMVVTFAALGGGQFLLVVDDPARIGLFVLTSVLVSMAVVPIALSRHPAPGVEGAEPASLREVFSGAPLAIVGGISAGMAHGALIGMGAVFATAIGLPVSRVAAFMGIALAGAIVTQYPVGRLSDRMDRRRVILVAALLAGAAATAAGLLAGAERPAQLVAFGGVLGGFTFPLYALSAAHLNDRLDPRKIVAAGSKLVLAYGIGAILGPVSVSVAMTLAGPRAFLWFQVGVHGVVAVYATYRLSRWAAVAARSPFAPYPSGATPALVSLAPEQMGAYDSPEEGIVVDAGGVAIRVRVRGEGEGIVLIHDVASSSRAWQRQVTGLARAGFRVIAYDLRGHGESGDAPSYGLRDHVQDLEYVLDELNAGSVHLVGLGVGAVVALAFAEADPGRTRSVALLSCAQTVIPSTFRGRLDGTVGTVLGGASQLVPRGMLARRFARSMYDPRLHPDRYNLLADDAERARPPAVVATLAAKAPPGRRMRAGGERLPRAPGMPTLVVLGRRDPATSPTALRRLREAFPAAKIEVLPDASHHLVLDNPHGFNALLKEFIGEVVVSWR